MFLPVIRNFVSSLSNISYKKTTEFHKIVQFSLKGVFIMKTVFNFLEHSHLFEILIIDLDFDKENKTFKFDKRHVSATPVPSSVYG